MLKYYEHASKIWGFKIWFMVLCMVIGLGIGLVHAKMGYGLIALEVIGGAIAFVHILIGISYHIDKNKEK